MIFDRLTSRRGLLIGILFVLICVCTVNLVQRRFLPIEIARTGNQIVIGRVTPESSAELNGIHSNDVIKVMNGRTPEHLADALWMKQWVQKSDSMHLTLARNDSLFTVTIYPDQRFSTSYIILDRLTATAFLVLCLLVWWHSRGDKTVSAFVRINLVIGITAMFCDYPNILPSEFAQISYMVIFLGIRSFIPAILLDFVFRFTSPQSSVIRSWLTVGLFSLAAIASLMSMSTAIGAALISTPFWLYAFDIANRYVYGISLLMAMVITIGRLIHAAWIAKTSWEHKRYRWLLLCLVIGATPYVFFVKLPTLLGLPSTVSDGIAMAMLLITPVGWGMAVTSFQMMRIEWTLSRTIVHLISVGILIYLGASIVMLGSEISSPNSWLALLTLGLGGALLLVLAFRTLLERVKWAVDHVYYGDWYDDTKVLHDIELKLSNVPAESDITKILTEDLSNLLKTGNNLLLHRSPEGAAHNDASSWIVAANQPAVASNINWANILPSISNISEPYVVSNSDPICGIGYNISVPLHHRGEILGWLLLSRKASGAPFSERDFRLLRALSPVAGMALDNMEMNRRILDHERRTVVIELAGGIAHEIGNALSPLMGQAQLIEHALQKSSETVSKDTVERPLQIMVDMCGRIRRIVQNLSKLSQPIQLQQITLCLNDVAEDAIQLMSETAGRIKRFQLLTSTEHDMDQVELENNEQNDSPYKLRKKLGKDLPMVKGDAQQLSQVFMNLILNAADAMEADGQGLLIVGTIKSYDNLGVIGYVEDTGPGIAPENMVKIFQPYYSTKPKGQGIGLGLTFVRSIIEAHHGHIHVLPLSHRGTRFEFFLPALYTTHADSTDH